MADALKQRIVAASEQVGIAGVVLDVLDDGDPAATERRQRFYQSLSFAPVPSPARCACFWRRRR